MSDKPTSVLTRVGAQMLTDVHSTRRTLTEVAYYPPHDPRKYFQSQFKKVETYLTKERDLPCLVCGVKHSTLKDPAANSFGAKQMEAHHRMIEWSLTNAIDLDKFNARIWPYFHVKHPEKYTAPFTQQQLVDWIDHDVDNLWVLCDVHHRGRLHGIHSITGPIWSPQDILLDTFIEEVEKRLAVERGPKPRAKKKKAPAAGTRKKKR